MSSFSVTKTFPRKSRSEKQLEEVHLLALERHNRTGASTILDSEGNFIVRIDAYSTTISCAASRKQEVFLAYSITVSNVHTDKVYLSETNDNQATEEDKQRVFETLGARETVFYVSGHKYSVSQQCTENEFILTIKKTELLQTSA